MSATDNDDEVIKKLMEQRADIKDALAKSEIIDDVLNDDVLTRKRENKNQPGMSATVNEQIPARSVEDFKGKRAELKYLPKGKLEGESEYSQRIEMTPWFPKTPQIVEDRQGALFAEAPEITGESADEFADFAKSATSDGKSFAAVIAKGADLIQRHPLFAIFVNRDVLPQDVIERGNIVSAAEAESRNLGAPKVVIYSGNQVLNFQKDAKGLAWIKLMEQNTEQVTWDVEPVTVYTVRVIDRMQVQSFKITETKDKVNGTKKVLQTLPAVNHGYTNTLTKEPAIPVVLAAPFRGESDIGRPMLRGCAMADVAATQVLSDLRWTLFVLGNPILVLTTDEPEGFNKINTNASRYVALKNAMGGLGEPETLEFVQLDPTGITKQQEMYERFCNEADSQGRKDGGAGVTQPVGEQSGISRAWEFKTGEERVLALITHELNQIFKPVIEIVANMLAVDPTSVGIEFNTDFDMGDPTQEMAQATAALAIIDKYDLPETRVLVLKEIIRTILPDLTEDQYELLDEEIEATKELPAEAVNPIMAAAQQNSDNTENTDSNKVTKKTKNSVDSKKQKADDSNK